MKLKEYIKQVIDDSQPGDIEFVVNLYADGTVSDVATGNTVRFIIIKENE